MCFKTVENWL